MGNIFSPAQGKFMEQLRNSGSYIEPSAKLRGTALGICRLYPTDI